MSWVGKSLSTDAQTIGKSYLQVFVFFFYIFCPIRDIYMYLSICCAAEMDDRDRSDRAQETVHDDVAHHTHSRGRGRGTERGKGKKGRKEGKREEKERLCPFRSWSFILGPLFLTRTWKALFFTRQHTTSGYGVPDLYGAIY